MGMAWEQGYGDQGTLVVRVVDFWCSVMVTWLYFGRHHVTKLLRVSDCLLKLRCPGSHTVVVADGWCHSRCFGVHTCDILLIAV